MDVKEEAGRRGPGGTIEPGHRQNEVAAAQLAEEMACFANTEGGGAIILGISDLGERIGTDLILEWLRHGIFELTGHMVTPAIRELEMDAVRLLVLRTAEALEPVRCSSERDGRATRPAPPGMSEWEADRRAGQGRTVIGFPCVSA